MSTSRDKRRQRFAEDPIFREQVRAEKRAWHAANKDRVNAERRQQYAEDPSRKLTQRAYMASNGRKIMLKCCYGMTPADYDALLARQNGVCAICETCEPGKPLHVDHCHVRNKVRGLLCRSCNLGLGNFKDDPRLLRAATVYLEAHAGGRPAAHDSRPSAGCRMPHAATPAVVIPADGAHVTQKKSTRRSHVLGERTKASTLCGGSGVSRQGAGNQQGLARGQHGSGQGGAPAKAGGESGSQAQESFKAAPA